MIKSQNKKAHYYKKEKELHYWKSPNLHGIDTVKSLKEAQALIMASKVNQKLMIYPSVWDKGTEKK